MTIYSAAAPRATLQLLIIALAAGVLILFPSYYYLFRVFKGEASSIASAANGIDGYNNRGPHSR
jgi:cytochrome bd-type quinol oxidase subunit 2